VLERVVRLPEAELERWAASYPYDISPVSDAAPFFWHFARFRDAWFGATDADDSVYDPEDAKGERVLGTVLLFAAAFGGSFLLLPVWLARDAWRGMPQKPSVLAYFAALGLGFMFYEVCVIQRFTLFLGYPTYSLTVTLFALLVFSGIGSLWSERFQGRARGALPCLLLGLALFTSWTDLGAPALLDRFAGSSLAVRVALATLSLAPLGLMLGCFMPLGLGVVSRLGASSREYVAWAWAVNGFFSVVSSVLATLLSMSWGFGTVLWLALAVYAAGVLALWRVAPASSG
jgi:hypothetical protein